MYYTGRVEALTQTLLLNLDYSYLDVNVKNIRENPLILEMIEKIRSRVIQSKLNCFDMMAGLIGEILRVRGFKK